MLDLAPFKILKTVGYEKEKFNLLLEFSFWRKDRSSEKQCWQSGLWHLRCNFKIGKNQNTKWVYKKIRNTCVVQLDAKYNWAQPEMHFPIREKTTNHVVLEISPFHHFPWDVLYAAYEWKTNLWNLNVGDKIILFLASRTKFENYNLSLESSFIGNFCFVVVFDKVS